MAGGRPKGAPNRKTQLLEELINEKYPEYNPVLDMIDLAQKSDDPEMRFKCSKEVAGYLFPKRKAVEVSGTNDEALVITWMK